MKGCKNRLMKNKVSLNTNIKNEKINWIELVEFINTNEVDFVAHVMTPFHIIGIKAFLAFLRKNGYQKLKGVIVIGQHIKSGYILNIDDIKVQDYCDAKVYYYESLQLSGAKLSKMIMRNIFPKHKQQKGKVLFVIHQAVPWVYFSTECIRKTDYTVINVITDDGLSSYFGIGHWAKMTAKDRGSILYGIKYIIQRSIADLVRRYYLIQTINFSFFSKKKLFNKQIVTFYRQILESEISEYGINEDKKYILYLSQPFEHSDEMWKIADKILLYFQNKGYKIYIKIHPRENEFNINKKIKAKFLNREFSAESIIAHSKNKPCFVIGWVSTSLLTLSAFWNIKCYTLYDYLPIKYQRYIASDFVKLINNPLVKNKYVKKLEISDIK